MCIKPEGIFVPKLKSASVPTARIGGNFEDKNQQGQQKNAAPHPGHSDQGANDESNQDFGRQ